jgi:hypothetical protein
VDNHHHISIKEDYHNKIIVIIGKNIQISVESKNLINYQPITTKKPILQINCYNLKMIVLIFNMMKNPNHNLPKLIKLSWDSSPPISTPKTYSTNSNPIISHNNSPKTNSNPTKNPTNSPPPSNPTSPPHLPTPPPKTKPGSVNS